MKIKSFLSSSKASLLSLGVVMAVTFSLQGCKEVIDDSNFAIKTEQTIADYLQSNSEFSYITEIFSYTPLSPFAQTSDQASPILSALSARGNYTVFLPTNESVTKYAVELGHSSYKELTAEEARLIAYSCIIDNGNNSAYESPEFPDNNGAFGLADLNDRLITCDYDEVNDVFVLNEGANTLDNHRLDIELANGYVHVLASESTPISPSNKGVADLIKEAPNMKGMSLLLEKTGWRQKMSVELVDIDMDYEMVKREQQRTSGGLACYVAQHRYLGFTGFVESDDVFESALGVSVDDTDAFLAAVKAKAEEVYGSEDSDDLTSEDNAVNRFVAYHFLDAKIASNMLIRHINEYGFGYGNKLGEPQTDHLSVDVWDYYVTIGSHPALLKVSQDGDTPVRATSHGLFLNRVSKYDTQNYAYLSSVCEGVGIKTSNKIGDEIYRNNAKNGFYYPIDGLLLDNEANQKNLSSERIRFDVTTILPELMSNNFRGVTYKHHYYFPKGYFSNITNESSATEMIYLNGANVGATNWIDYQNDEFMASGLFDFVLKLPPVPRTGTYELRMAVNHNTLRGMAQLYLGENPYNLQPLGLPYDMRQNMIDNDNIGYVADEGLSEEQMQENDKVMRNHGFMKGPRYYASPGDGTGNGDIARKLRANNMGALRKILTQQTFEKDKTYYIRFKSALEKTDSQFWIDFFEFVPTSVYNGTEPEDQW